MLIEQLIEFELRRPEPLIVYVLSTTDYFCDMTKQKSKEYCRVGLFYYLLL